MGVKQVAAGQRNPQNRLDDVADGAVVGQADLLCRVHEVATTGKIQKETDVWSESMLLVYLSSMTKHITWKTLPSLSLC